MNSTHLFKSVLIGFLSLQLISCGTIIYPERKGQKGGRLDVGIALLDTLGLLFFFIPGVIAFAVDFSTGAIYLPNTDKSQVDREQKIKIVRFDPDNYSPALLEEIIHRETGKDFHLDDGKMNVVKLKNRGEIHTFLIKD